MLHIRNFMDTSVPSVFFIANDERREVQLWQG